VWRGGPEAAPHAGDPGRCAADPEEFAFAPSSGEAAPCGQRGRVQVDELQLCLLPCGGAESMCRAGAVGDAALRDVDEAARFRAITTERGALTPVRLVQALSRAVSSPGSLSLVARLGSTEVKILLRRRSFESGHGIDHPTRRVVLGVGLAGSPH
jgi:hypothetical protein